MRYPCGITNKNSKKFEEEVGKSDTALVADVPDLSGTDLGWPTPPDKFVSVVLFHETKSSARSTLLVLKDRLEYSHDRCVAMNPQKSHL